MTAPKAFYITTAISYPNGPPHIGHAYEAIATDILARFKRLDGVDTYFLTGVDDHGQKMVQTAKERGVSPQELADEMAPLFKKMCAVLNISNDDFIRTSEPRHILAAQTLWEKLAAKGDIYLDKYAGWYSVRDEAYYGEDELSDGDDGKKYAPTGTPVEWIEEESYFFRLSAYADRLLELYEKHPDFILPETRRNEVVAFVKRGLNDLSISRTKIDWGVPVPGDPKHVMYVWVDALTNYITGVGYPNVESASFKHYWPADVHIIGKDIVRFHAMIWPALLMAAEVDLPKRIYGHGFLFNRGEKMSKSVGNVIDPFTITQTYGVDQIRYFFAREVPFGQDGSYSHETVVNRINADLANDLGNLAQRSLSMIAKNLEGKVPEPGALTDEDKAILDQAGAMLDAARVHMDGQQIHQALGVIWDTVAEANRYFAGQEPWALKKTDPARMGTVLYVTAEVIRRVAILAQPVVPSGAAKLLDLLAVLPEARSFASLEDKLVPGTALPAPSGVFPRFVDEEKGQA
ncbi:methionyl-tRNA synthetase [Tepidicaulis marinus]|uniref:Methionine--tRNA ligase n=1 Tax=Tepidicaulis marinus TaxID=1333998 RepID=A0A081BFD5_9HYPH|nr:methionine--tRNA ligase [Tepidicaulis marinus]GAK46753.1 methionyl-tRNA synthetase [Tepidicaulis marinus]